MTSSPGRRGCPALTLSAAGVEQIVQAVEPFECNRDYGAFWDTVIGQDGKAAINLSVERYLGAIRGQAK